MLVKLRTLSDYDSFLGNYIDSAGLFWGSRKNTYTEMSEIGVAFLEYSNKHTNYKPKHSEYIYHVGNC